MRTFERESASSRVPLRHHTREIAAALSRLPLVGAGSACRATDCGLWRVRLLRLRCSCLRVCASAALPRQTPQTVLRRIYPVPVRVVPVRKDRDSELSAPLHSAPHGAGRRHRAQNSRDRSRGHDAFDHRLRSDSVPVAETSETRELRISLRSHALSRVSSERGLFRRCDPAR